MKPYKEAQIIKHALLNYVKRPGASEKDIAAEKQLLKKYAERAEFLKQKYGIKIDKAHV